MNNQRFFLILTAIITLSGVGAAYASTGADPTRPYPEFKKEGGVQSIDQASPEKTVWVLEAVMIYGRGRFATINGRRVTLGETVNGAKVVRIEPDRVVLREPAGFITLSLAPSATGWIKHAQ